jgi:hypothetical protein
VARTVYIPKAGPCAFSLGYPLEIRLLAKELIVSSYQKLQQRWFNLNGRFFLKELIPEFSIKSVDNSNQFGTKSKLLSSSKKKRMIILQRFTEFYYTFNWRAWHDRIFELIVNEYAKVFVNHTIVPIKSNDERYRNCLECSIWQFTQADIIVGVHGIVYSMIVT